MAGNLRVAFWNVQNLYAPGVVIRGPQSQPELDAKLDVLAEVVAQFFNDEGPDVMGFAEIGSESILRELIKRLSDPYDYCWEAPGMNDQTGLGLIARRNLLRSLTILDVYRPSITARPRSMIVQCELRSDPEPFLIVVNHWKSRRGAKGVHRLDRLQTADWLGDYLASSSPCECALVMGDFNAEPYEPPFGELRLRGRRTFSNALWANATPAYLYNTAWRTLTEPDVWEDASAPKYQEPRPKTTYGTSGYHVLDHLLVSGKALRKGPLTLQEKSVTVFYNPRTSQRSTTGVLRPYPWDYGPTGDHKGCSDHFPLLATFTIR